MNDKAKFLETSDEQKCRIEKIRQAFSKIYDAIDEVCVSGRETSLAYKKWGNKCIKVEV